MWEDYQTSVRWKVGKENGRLPAEEKAGQESGRAPAGKKAGQESGRNPVWRGTERTGKEQEK